MISLKSFFIVCMGFAFQTFVLGLDLETENHARQIQSEISKNLLKLTMDAHSPKKFADLHRECQIQLKRPNLSPASCFQLVRSKDKNSPFLLRILRQRKSADKSLEIERYIRLRRSENSGTDFE